MDVGAIEADDLQRQPGEQETVADTQLSAEPFLHLTQPPPAPPEGDVHRHRLDDGAGIQSVLRRQPRMRQTPQAIAAQCQPVVAFIGAQRIAAGGNETQHLVEAGARQAGIGRGTANFDIDSFGIERRRRGQPEQMLRQHIEPAGAKHVVI